MAIAMLQSLFNFSSRRRRLLLYKIIALSFFLFVVLLWINSRGGPDPTAVDRLHSKHRSRYQKAEGAPEGLGAVEEEWNDEEDEDERRRIVEKENMDEFLVPVLQEYKYVEVDLREKHSSPFDDYDEEIREDLVGIVPGLGEKGEKAEVPAFQNSVAAEIAKKDAFNRLLSDMMSPNRTTPDTREKSCRKVVYDKTLPDSSIVIIYTNEAYSSLIRTLHSVINKTPPHLLREIILVDDFSDKRDLKGKLERYIATHFPLGKIRLVKLLRRSGLIRARMVGAHLALGNVLVFLDAHCECVDTWLEPLLQRIKEDRKAVVCPIIDVIDDKTMEYYHGNGAFFQIGGFTWSGHFTWINIPSYEAARKVEHHSPTRTPTMAGGLFAIDRKYFWEIGSYDSDMQLWGGENLEMSFRVWQCGGSVEIIPCSRVGHIFRSFHPYSFPGNVDSHGLNTARLAETWMDEYKEIFYSHREELKHADFGDVKKRIAFRERMGCKSFTWYLDNVYKEKFRLWYGSSQYGQVKNKVTKRCLDNMQHTESEEYTLSVYPCHNQLYPSQTFYLSNNGELRRENECAAAKSGSDDVEMHQCERPVKQEKWKYTDQKIIHVKSGKCLTVDVTGESGKDKVSLMPCVSSPNQNWIFDNFKKFNPKDKS